MKTVIFFYRNKTNNRQLPEKLSPVLARIIKYMHISVYLGSIMDTNGRIDNDVRARIGKAMAALIMFNKIWKSREISIPTKLYFLTEMSRLCYCMDQRRGVPQNPCCGRSKLL